MILPTRRSSLVVLVCLVSWFACRAYKITIALPMKVAGIKRVIVGWNECRYVCIGGDYKGKLVVVSFVEGIEG